MARILCEILHTEEENDNGYLTDCVYATCSKCGHETMSWGDSEASIKRCLVLMREECPEEEENFYDEE